MSLHDKKANIRFLLLIIICHALWFIGALTWKHFYNGDSYEYIYLAENMKHGYYYGSNPVLPANDYRLSVRTPVYSLILSAFYSLFGYHNLLVILLQNALSIVSCWLIFDTFRRISTAKKYSWIYWIFVLAYPAQFYFSDMIAPDTVLQFFLMLYFRQLILSLLHKSPQRTGMMSLWLILATLTKPIVYPFLFLHFLFAIVYALKSKKKLVLLLGALPLMVMIGYGAWNQKRTGLFHISSIQSINLLNFNVHFFLKSKYGGDYADSVINREKEKIETLPGLKAKYEYSADKAKAIIKENFWGYSFFHARESARFFIEPGKSELDLFTGFLGYDYRDKSTNFYLSYQKEGVSGAWRYLTGYPLLPILLLVVLFNVLRIFGWLLFVFDKKTPLVIRIVTSIYILYFAFITGPVANARYFLPVLLVMSGCSLMGYSGFITRIKNKRKPTLA